MVHFLYESPNSSLQFTLVFQLLVLVQSIMDTLKFDSILMIKSIYLVYILFGYKQKILKEIIPVHFYAKILLSFAYIPSK